MIDSVLGELEGVDDFDSFVFELFVSFDGEETLFRAMTQSTNSSSQNAFKTIFSGPLIWKTKLSGFVAIIFEAWPM